MANMHISIFLYFGTWRHIPDNTTAHYFPWICLGVWEVGVCVGGGGGRSLVCLNRNERNIIQIPNLKLLPTSTQLDGTFLVKVNISWQKKKAEPFLQLNTKYNSKHRIERRLTSSVQTTTTQSHGYVTSVWKCTELLVWKTDTVSCRTSNGLIISNCHNWCDIRNHHRVSEDL